MCFETFWAGFDGDLEGVYAVLGCTMPLSPRVRVLDFEGDLVLGVRLRCLGLLASACLRLDGDFDELDT